MTTITRENIRLELRHATGRLNSDSTPEVEFRTYGGTLSWDTDARTLDLLKPGSGKRILRLSSDSVGLPGSGNKIILNDVPYPELLPGVVPEAAGALDGLRAQGVITDRGGSFAGSETIVTLADDLGAAAQAACTRTAVVALFKDTGKYSTSMAWRVPVNAIGPADMLLSPDFRQIDGGGVVVEAEAGEQFPDAENWGHPYILGLH